METTSDGNKCNDKIESRSSTSYYCECTEPRIFRLTFNGGSSGIFEFECCRKCYDENDKRFLVKEEKISYEERCNES